MAFPNMLHAQDTCLCDYVASGYYQLVYEADIAYLEGNDRLAYEKLQKAEQTCELLNQPTYQEMETYCILLLKNKNFAKAIHYMEKLATEYGAMPLFIFSVLDKDSVLKNDLLLAYPTFIHALLPAIMQKCNAFYTPQRQQLAAELTDILISDQEVRKNWETDSKGPNAAAYFAKLKETDSIHAKQLFAIIEKCGFPNRKRYGSSIQNTELRGGIGALFMHNSGNYEIEKMLLQQVHAGECEPYVFGAFIDKGILEGKWAKKSLYGIWENIQENQIIDNLHVDERRISIGMPTRAMAKKRTELLKIRK
jgi:hypothetical protein